jgi:hypothetical protein
MASIQPIVEGHGEQEAVPMLLRRFVAEAQLWQLQIGKAVRQPRSKLVLEHSLRRSVRLALRQPDCAAIMVLLDADKDCPKEDAMVLKEWARDEAGRVPCEVVMAKCEYESWFLASIESLRGVADIRMDARPPEDPERIRGAKSALERYMMEGGYAERVDQPKLTSYLDFALASRCRSFRQIATAFGRLAAGAGYPIEGWPPAGWEKGAS